MECNINWTWLGLKILNLLGCLQSTIDISTDALTAADLLGANASVQVEAALGIDFSGKFSSSSSSASSSSPNSSTSSSSPNSSTSSTTSKIDNFSNSNLSVKPISFNDSNLMRTIILDSPISLSTNCVEDYGCNNFHPIWGMLTIAIIFLPGLMASISDTMDKWKRDKEMKSNPCSCVIYLFGFGIPKSVSFPVLVIWYQLAAALGTGTAQDQAKMQWYLGMEGHIESGPQAILQVFILLNGKTVTLFQIGCLLVSIISVGKCVSVYDMVPEEQARLEDNPVVLKEKGLRLLAITPVYMLSFIIRGGMFVTVAAFLRYIAMAPLIIQFCAIFILSRRTGLTIKNSFLTSVTNILVHGNPVDNNPFELTASRFQSTAHAFRVFTSIISSINYGTWLIVITICIKNRIFPFEGSKSMLTDDLSQVDFGQWISVDPLVLCGIFFSFAFIHLLLLFSTKTILPKSYQEVKESFMTTTFSWHRSTIL